MRPRSQTGGGAEGSDGRIFPFRTVRIKRDWEIGAQSVNSSERQGRPQKGEWNDGEFESFLAEIAPALENSVSRLGVAGSLGGQRMVDPTHIVLEWTEISDRIIEELR